MSPGMTPIGSDHPRIRGEHRGAGQPGALDRGSSPHTRGAPAPGFSIRPGAGIIPAYAGSTFPSLASTSARRDHPRIRGEHPRGCGDAGARRGSSPHTRGARSRSQPRAFQPRIIPAYAGSTGSGRVDGLRRWDHPRIRGEHFPEPGLDVGQAGSSPHTRGARPTRSSCSDRQRIIPAYAGSTRSCPALSARCRDHPRIRGEHAIYGEAVHYCPGSSPHTRGAHPRC